MLAVASMPTIRENGLVVYDTKFAHLPMTSASVQSMCVALSLSLCRVWALFIQ